MSTYQYSNYGSTSTAAVPQKLSEYCDFITFLGIAQSLQIDFLPITWQQGLKRIGEGATGEIREALLDKDTSFAFKRRLFRESFNFEELKRLILPTLVAEISILHIPSIRYCPNIINLVGVCWEVYCEDEYTLSRDKPADFSKAGVIPVLVFQKSKYGDLHTFMVHGAGRSLGFDERLHLCIGVAEAISQMHALGMCHRCRLTRLTFVFQISFMAISNLKTSWSSRILQKFVSLELQTSATLPSIQNQAI